tara:strand:- start:187 stop:690 length:504 start_codon:yes stop_codon:yes gene_type:complete
MSDGSITLQHDPVNLISNSAADTRNLGALFGRIAFPGLIIELIGPPGSGKTEFTRGIAQGLGITREIRSPTFVLIHEYRDGRIPLFHMDFYRLLDGQPVGEMDIFEYENDSGLIVLEWADGIEPGLSANRICVKLGFIEADSRSISIYTDNVIGEKFMKSLRINESL